MTCTWRTFTPTALPKRGTTQVAYSTEELLAGMISGVTGGETKWYDIAVPATMVVPRFGSAVGVKVRHVHVMGDF